MTKGKQKKKTFKEEIKDLKRDNRRLKKSLKLAFESMISTAEFFDKLVGQNYDFYNQHVYSEQNTIKDPMEK